MDHDELVAKLRMLPRDKQVEVMDFVDFLVARYGRRKEGQTGSSFTETCICQAFRDVDDDPVVYGPEDLKERWR